MRRFVLWAGSAGTIFCLLALLACFFIPGWLEPSRADVTTVKPKFTTPHEQEELKLQAELFGESVSSHLYDVSDTQPSYLPAKGSLQHRFLGALALLLSVESPAAAREDVLPDASENRILIDQTRVYPIQTRTVGFFLGWFKIGLGLAAGVLAIISIISIIALVAWKRVPSSASSASSAAPS